MSDDELLLGFRFGVSFHIAGDSVDTESKNIDTRFQKVSGLGASVQLRTYNEGGLNLYAHRLPEPITYENLVLERGRVVKSALGKVFADTFASFTFKPFTVIVTLYDDAKLPRTGWMFQNAYPVRWRLSDLDANQSAVAIETLELAYTNMQAIKV
jgi:phage tail-like protein